MIYNELPGDNVAINQIREISYKTYMLLRKHGYDTVGQVRRASNETLLQTVGLTQNALCKLRRWCPIDDAVAKTNSPEMAARDMTIRDHFATAAMQAVLKATWSRFLTGSNESEIEGIHVDQIEWDLIAGDSYQMADAMLKVRALSADQFRVFLNGEDLKKQVEGA